jgi:predicted RNase H-like nuclease (RuvC/YqgF family)
MKVGKVRRSVMTSHGFRKFYITECVRSNIINHSTWKYLVGHKLPNPDSSYILLTEEDRLREYVKIIPLLTISEREKQRLQTRIRELEATEAELSRDYKYLRRKSEEYEARVYEVMAEMKEFKEWRNTFTKAATDLKNYTKGRDFSSGQ